MSGLTGMKSGQQSETKMQTEKKELTIKKQKKETKLTMEIRMQAKYLLKFRKHSEALQKTVILKKEKLEHTLLREVQEELLTTIESKLINVSSKVNEEQLKKVEKHLRSILGKQPNKTEEKKNGSQKMKQVLPKSARQLSRSKQRQPPKILWCSSTRGKKKKSKTVSRNQTEEEKCSTSFVLSYITEANKDHSYSILSGCIFANEPSPDYMRKFDDIICDFLREQGVPGAAIFISYHGKPIYKQGYGINCCGELISSSSHFRIASISKVLTAIAVLRLCEVGLLTLNDKVFGKAGILSKIWPEDKSKMNQFEFITIENLLQHSAGWDRDLVGDHVFWYQKEKHKAHIDAWDSESLIKYVLNFNLSFQRGSQHGYSNLGYLILGMVIEAVTGMKYEEYVRAIFREIGIDDINIGNTKQDKVHYEEVKYYNNNDPPVEASVFGKDKVVAPQYGSFPMENTGAYGGWVTCAESLVTILDSLIVNDGRPAILSEQTVAVMFSPPNYATDEAWYGLGVDVEDNGSSFGHTGAMDGTSTTVHHDKSGLTWSFLLNSWAKDMDLDGVIKYALSTVQGLPMWSGVELKYGLGENSIMSADKLECVSILLPRKRLLSEVTDMKRDGYFISWINAISLSEGVKFNIIWQKQIENREWSVIIDVESDKFNDCVKQLKSGWEVTSLESYTVKNVLYHLFVFRASKDSDQKLYVLDSIIQHMRLVEYYELHSYMLQSQSIIEYDDKKIISAVYGKVQIVASAPTIWIDVSVEEFVSRLAESIEDGLFLKYLQFYTTKGLPQISAIWADYNDFGGLSVENNVFQRYDVTKYGFLFELGESLKCNRPVSFISAYTFEDVTYFAAVWETFVRS